MNHGSKTRLALYLFEPRMLLRTVISSVLDQEYSTVQSSQTLAYLTESVCGDTVKNKTVLAGIAGAGAALPDLLRFIRNVKALKIKTVVWVPAGYPWMCKLLNALYVLTVLSEENLVDELLPAINSLPHVNPLLNRKGEQAGRPRRITLTELDILLQFAAGMSSKEMADFRQCSYKTIFSWKHNICEALNIDTHAQWLEMLTEIVQLSSMYQAEKQHGTV